MLGVRDRDPGRGQPPPQESIQPPAEPGAESYHYQSQMSHSRYDALLAEIEKLKAELLWERSGHE